ncbi:MAG: copper resistance protein B [Sphingomicrobium sp.]
MRHRAAACIFASFLIGGGETAGAQALSGDVDLFEYHLDGDRNLLFDGAFAYSGETQAVVGKLVVGGSIGRNVDQIEGQLLYSRAIGGGFNLEAGIKHEFRPHPHLTYAGAGISGEPRKGLALEAYSFVSEKGDVIAEAKAIYEYQFADRLTLQPRVGFNLAAQDVPDQGIASGFTNAELGLRLRYEVTEKFAPYVGISHERLLGRTANIARDTEEVVRSTHFVFGFSSTF